MQLSVLDIDGIMLELIEKSVIIFWRKIGDQRPILAYAHAPKYNIVHFST